MRIPFQYKNGNAAALLAVFMLWATVFAQTSRGEKSLSLKECQQKARNNFPLVRQLDIIEKTSQFTLSNASKGYLPNITLYAQANYLSDVTSVPISSPLFSIDPVSKDQYKFYGEIYQPLTEFYKIGKSKKEARSSAEMERKTAEVEFYKLRERVNHLFFGSLLISAQIEQTDYLKKDLSVGIRNIEASLFNGLASENELEMMQAELLGVEQKVIEWKTVRNGYINMLSQIIGEKLDSSVNLETPKAPPMAESIQVRRPEEDVFASQMEAIEVKKELLNSRLIPNAGLYVQGGYGRPALNQLNDDFDTYYILGARLMWNLQGFYTTGTEKKILELKKKSVNLQKEIFEWNRDLGARQQNSDILKYQKLLEKDKELITLRQNIKKRAQLKLENGVLSANEYIRFVNDEDKARQSEIIHKIQLLTAKYQYQITMGDIK